jgi:asparagine synthase (glutamine-hydrolysing)
MCGIFFFYGHVTDHSYLEKYASTLQHRGPDNTTTLVVDKAFMSFHRLAINGLDLSSDQPMEKDGVFLLCNGEIFNYKELALQFNLDLQTGSDCEVVLELYLLLADVGEVCKQLDGDFAFVLFDTRRQQICIGRDPVGIRSLYIASDTRDGVYIASEMKAIPGSSFPVQFPPGHVCVIDCATIKINMVRFSSSYTQVDRTKKEEELLPLVRATLERAVHKRMLSDRPIGCVLSGGLDSTVVASIVTRLTPGVLNTYTIGMEGAPDLMWARKASEFLGTNHIEFIVSEKEFLDHIPATIQQIESFDVTTVRASTGNNLLAQKIAQATQDKVIFCGDVSDELFGSYKGFQFAMNEKEFLHENIRMMNNIHFFDVLRAEKSIAGAGLEARVPFADCEFVELIMSLPSHLKMFDNVRIEKFLLRKAFTGCLPPDLLWRRKEAFSDGISSEERSWYTVIREHVDALYSDEEYRVRRKKFTHMTPYDKESLWYREIFERSYPGQALVIPYFWKHPFTREKDPSARLLSG